MLKYFQNFVDVYKIFFVKSLLQIWNTASMLIKAFAQKDRLSTHDFFQADAAHVICKEYIPVAVLHSEQRRPDPFVISKNLCVLKKVDLTVKLSSSKVRIQNKSVSSQNVFNNLVK